MEYKEVTLKTTKEFDEKSKRVVKSFLDEFNRHIYFEPMGSYEVKLFVNNLDFERFKSRALEVKANNGEEEVLSAIDDLVEAVNSIGSYGLKSGKRVYVDFNKERKVKNRKQKSEKRTSSIRNTEKSIEENILPFEYENAIVCADSLDVLRKLPNNCIDVMITSPPYNFGLEYENGADDKKWDDYFNQLFAILEETKRVLKYGGRMIINVQPLFSDYIPTHHIISKHLLDIGMLWKGEILWEKNNYNCKYTAWGSWKSPSSPYLKYTWEFIEVFCKGDLKHSGKTEDIDITAEEFKKWVVAKWSIAPERNMKEYGHPAMFPENLVSRCLKLFSFKNDIILDVFNGVGTTTSVARMLDRRYLGVDISTEYCNVAEKRLASSLF